VDAYQAIVSGAVEPGTDDGESGTRSSQPRTMTTVPSERILVVDDESGIRELVGTYLRAEGFEVDEAADGEEALRRFAGREPALMVLDLRLPGLNGLDVLREVRRTSSVYVIVLTARADEADKLIGLELGADDYVTKPFSPRELVARVRAVLRRRREEAEAATVADGDLRFEGLEVDPARREVTVDGVPVELTTLEFDLLAALAGAPGHVFTRRQLIERVWGWDFYGDERIVDVHIRNLRKALGDPADAPRFVGTVRGVGYKLVAVRG
jgi:DNA-binding response OmpR family regulator